MSPQFEHNPASGAQFTVGTGASLTAWLANSGHLWIGPVTSTPVETGLHGSQLFQADRDDEFWLADDSHVRLVRWTGSTVIAVDSLPLPPGTQQLVKASSRAADPYIWLAYCPPDLLNFTPQHGWQVVGQLSPGNWFITYRPRSRTVLLYHPQHGLACLSTDGLKSSESTFALRSGRSATYDDVLGRLWVLVDGGRKVASVQVDPWPPVLCGLDSIPQPVTRILVSPSGEWLALCKTKSATLYNIAARKFLALEEVDLLDLAFTDRNDLLVLLKDEQVRYISLPARIESRPTENEIGLSTMWKAEFRKSRGA